MSLYRRRQRKKAPGQADGHKHDRRPDVHGRAGAGELLHRARGRRRPGGDRRPRRRGRPPAARDRGARDRDRRGDPGHPHPLRPRRRGGAGGARRPGRRSTAPSSRRQVLANIMDFVPWPGFGPFESYEADHTVKGGETLELAGLRDRRDRSRRATAPATSPTRSPSEGALFSGDVLFQGSVGRVDLPGGDWPTLLASIEIAGRRIRAGDDRLSRPHGHHHARPRARDEPVPARARAARPVIQAPRGTFDVLPDDAARRERARGARRRGSSAPPATGGSRRRRSRRPSCSRAGWGRRPTSSRRRCTRSTTAAGAR